IRRHHALGGDGRPEIGPAHAEGIQEHRRQRDENDQRQVEQREAERNAETGNDPARPFGWLVCCRAAWQCKRSHASPYYKFFYRTRIFSRSFYKANEGILICIDTKRYLLGRFTAPAWRQQPL